MFSESPIKRRQSRQIMVGNVPVGGGAPISVQSMTNTSTADVAATVDQIRRIQAAGADIVRVSVPSLDEAVLIVCALIRAILLERIDCARLSPKRGISISPFVSVLMPVRWAKTYCANTMSPPLKPWSSRLCAMLSC